MFDCILQCPFIFRSDLVPKGGCVYIDVEKVSLKPTITTKHEQLAGTVAIVNDANDLPSYLGKKKMSVNSSLT